MAGLYNYTYPAWALANQPPTLDTALQSVLIGDVSSTN